MSLFLRLGSCLFPALYIMYIYFDRIFIFISTYEILTEYLRLHTDITSGSSYVLPNSFLCISSFEKPLIIFLTILIIMFNTL